MIHVKNTVRLTADVPKPVTLSSEVPAEFRHSITVTDARAAIETLTRLSFLLSSNLTQGPLTVFEPRSHLGQLVRLKMVPVDPAV